MCIRRRERKQQRVKSNKDKQVRLLPELIYKEKEREAGICLLSFFAENRKEVCVYDELRII